MRGMNLEASHGFHEAGEYTEAKNIEILDYEVTSIDGTEVFSDFAYLRPDNKILGSYATDSTVFIFSANTSDNSSEIGKVVNGSYTTIVNDSDSGYWQDPSLNVPESRFNFTLNEEIEVKIRVANNAEVYLYWVSSVNKPRYINASLDYSSADYRFVNLDKETSIFTHNSTTVCNYNRIINGGSLKIGSYQFFTRYVTRDNIKTEVGLVSNVIPVVETLRESTTKRKDYVGANFDSPVVNKSIEIKVLNIDYSFEFLEVGVIRFAGAANIPEYYIFDRINLARNIGGVFTPLYNRLVTFTGTFIEKVSQDEFSIRKPSYDNAKFIDTDNNRLYLFNLTERPEIDIQEEIANKLILKYDIEEVVYSADYITDYADEYYAVNKKSYRRGEPYSFGVWVEFTNGKKSFCYHTPAYYSKTDGTFYPHETGDGGKVLADTGSKQLGTYFSNNLYSKSSYYRDVSGNDLYQTNIRHHLMPTLLQEPHYRTDGADVFIRILGVKIANLSSVIDACSFKDQIKAIHLVREERNTFNKTNIHSQGFCNTLLKHDGKMKGGAHYRQGDNATNSHDYSLSGTTPKRENYRNASENLETYSINPYNGVTHIHDYNSGTFPLGKIKYAKFDFVEDYTTAIGYVESGRNPDGSGTGNMSEGKDVNAGTGAIPDFSNYSGVALDNNAKKNVAFFSPESVLLKESWKPPLSSNISAVAKLYHKPYLVFDDKLTYTTSRRGLFGGYLPKGTKLEARELVFGSYSDDHQFPFVRSFRSPFFHIHGRHFEIKDLFDNYTNPLQTRTILAAEYTQNNGKVKSNDEILALKTVVNNSVFKLYNYDNEGFLLLALNDVLSSTYEDTGKYVAILGGTTDFYLNELYRSDCIDTYINDGSYARESAMNYIGYQDLSGMTTNIPKEEEKSLSISRTLYNIESKNETQYGLLDSNSYIPVATFVNYEGFVNSGRELIFISDSDKELLFNGDTFISWFWFRTSFRQYYRFAYYNGDETVFIDSDGDTTAGGQVFGGFGRIKTKEGAEFRQGLYTLCESSVNCNYRHRIAQRDVDGNIVAYGAPFYPNCNEAESLSPESEQCGDYGYNIQYSFENNVKQYFLKPANFTEERYHGNLVIASERISDSENVNKFIDFKVNTFIQVGKSTGEITGVKLLNNRIYIWTASASYSQVTEAAQQYADPSNPDSLILGTSKIFSLPANRLVTVDGNGAGCIHPKTIKNTESGIIFLDALNKQVYIISDRLTSLTDKHVKTYFNSTINKSLRYIAGYDKFKGHYYLTADYDAEVNDNPTIGLNVKTGYWVSFYDYVFTDYLTYNNDLIGIIRGSMYYLNKSKIYGLYIANLLKNAYISGVIADTQTIKFNTLNVDARFLKVAENYNDINKFFSTLSVEADNQKGSKELSVLNNSQPYVNRFDFNVAYQNKQYQVKVPSNMLLSGHANINDAGNFNASLSKINRFVSKYIKYKFTFINDECTYKFYLSAIKVNGSI